MRRTLLAALLVLALPLAAGAAKPRKEKEPPKDAPKPRMSGDTFTGLTLRGIGPALMSGRIGDLAVDPRDRATWYAAVASGGVWKTVNAGTTWTPIFDAQGSYSIGCVTVDPRDPLTVWVGTGENNSQRSVAYGDGVYRSRDGGKSWENVGLKASEHIGKILVDPRDSDVVYVAAQGPLWAPGGDRGLYKTVDGGATWEPVLTISENTGVTDVVLDPRNPDVLYAAAYQRRRHVWTLINGGPEAGIHKSVDGGKTWKKLSTGLPTVDMGRIGLALAPEDPDTLYALVEAAGDAGGFYVSEDGGGSFEKRGSYNPGSAQYYQEIFADPGVPGRIYSMDTWMMVTEDGGRTWKKVGERFKHVDNHALVIDPQDSDHLLAGCDGGIYESWDRGATWDFKANLPVTQFYKVAVDQSQPFYYVYGGTQDNNTQGGPVRTATAHGITNNDWFITVGGDGFQAQVDPTDPNVVYTQSQYGVLQRFDRRTGEAIDIQPQPGAGEGFLRWNWDSPLIISPHHHARLYFAAQKLFRSDDRGDSWRAVSPDLTRQIDRNALKVMGRVWSVDAVAKNASTSLYGNVVALDESPKVEGLLYVGTDDGLVQVSEDGGATWRKQDRFPGVPDNAYVSRLTASPIDPDVVYAAFDHHKMGDFRPYLLRSADRGRTWTSIAGDLPERGTVYSLAADHVERDLLFAGTEFGLFFTRDGGRRWVPLKGGMPTIQVRDLAIQRRENDLVAATFGRGFYVLDDYTPLRQVDEAALEKDALLFPVKDAWMYVPSQPLGLKDKASLGDSFFTAPNPPFGAVVTYYLKEEVQTLRKKRQKVESELVKDGKDLSYPSWEDLAREDREEAPAVLVTIADEEGNVVRRLTGPVGAGFQRVAWDLRYPAATPTSLETPEYDPWSEPAPGPLAAPGRYTASIARRVGGVVTPLAGPVSFQAVPLGQATLPPADRPAILAFQRKTARLQRAVFGATRSLDELDTRLAHLRKAVEDTPGASPALADRVRALQGRTDDLQVAFSGDPARAKRNEGNPPSITDRVQQIVYGHWYTTVAPTATHRKNYDIAADAFEKALADLRALAADAAALEGEAEKAGAPWTPGRLPTWSRE